MNHNRIKIVGVTLLTAGILGVVLGPMLGFMRTFGRMEDIGTYDAEGITGMLPFDKTGHCENIRRTCFMNISVKAQCGFRDL